MDHLVSTNRTNEGELQGKIREKEAAKCSICNYTFNRYWKVQLAMRAFF